MKIAVFSDSHRYTDKMVNAVETERPDAIIHLGDHETDAFFLEREFPDIPVYAVCGNCDLYPRSPERLIIELGGKRLFLTHGHAYHVKFSPYSLINAAMASGADVLLFGHTHMAHYSCVEGLHIINPGASGSGGCYGILTVDGSGISYVQHGP